jgi:hypothetical protein
MWSKQTNNGPPSCSRKDLPGVRQHPSKHVLDPPDTSLGLPWAILAIEPLRPLFTTNTAFLTCSSAATLPL